MLPGILAGSSALGKWIFGYIAQLRCVNRLYVYQFAILMQCVALALLGLSTEYGHFALFAVALGLGEGGSSSYIIIVNSLCVRADQLGLSFGLMYTITSVFTVAGPPFTGNISTTKIGCKVNTKEIRILKSSIMNMKLTVISSSFTN